MANKTPQGHPFSEDMIQKIWEKAQEIPGEDPALVRKDICGAVIHRHEFRHSSKPLSFGWEIDHIKPLSQGGTDDYFNLQPLHWENNLAKGQEYPSWKCAVKGNGTQNERVMPE